MATVTNRRLGWIRQDHVNHLAQRPKIIVNGNLRRAVEAAAEAEHAAYPQYVGHWAGPEWVLVRLTRRITTKLGLAFERGDVTLGKRGPITGEWTVYSLRNGIDTAVMYSVEALA
jgi:hypothetical protein